jgi:hypothetical protein
MKSRGWFAATVAVAACAGWFGRSVLADDPPKAPAGADEMFKAAAKPGEQHERMVKMFEGEWTTHLKGKDMDGSTVESDGTASFKSLLGGRFLQQEVHGEYKKEPFTGYGWMGYDNNTKQFVGVWIDSMGTGIMSGTGQETEKGKAWSFKDTMTTPMGPMTSRDEIKVVSDKEFTYTMYMSFQPGAPEAPMMEITYKRK